MKALRLSVAFALISIAAFGQKDFYDQQWSKVYKHELKFLPRSAASAVDSIYRRAKKENNVVQITKALLYQSKFALDITEDAEVTITNNFNKEIATAKPPLKNILQSLLATIYWNYLQENRGIIYARSRTRETVNIDDFRTWDAEQLFKAIHENFQQSLVLSKKDAEINLSALHEVLIQGDDSQKYRPTLYDLLCHNAITFYTTGEQLLPHATTDVQLEDSTLFFTYDQIPVAHDSLSPVVETLKLYKSLINFHQARSETSAVVQLLLERMQYIANGSILEDKESVQKRALNAMITRFYDHDASTLVQYELAKILNTEGSEYDAINNPSTQFRKKEALAMCDDAIARFPSSDGADRCRSLKDDILTQALTIDHEEYIPVNQAAPMLVSYRNISELKLSAFAIENMDVIDGFFKLVSDSLRLQFLRQRTSYVSWSVQLKDLGDHQRHRTEIALPALPSNAYILLATSLHPNKDTRATAFGAIQVTDLAITQLSLRKYQRFQVVKRMNGEPVAGANVYMESVNNTTQYENSFVTNRDGFFESDMTAPHYLQLKTTVSWNNDTAVVSGMYLNPSYYHETDDEVETTARTFLFTDRSIYRPGQTVYFKGILTKTRDKKTSVVAGEYVNVFMEDVNGQQVGSLRLKTNAYGSFSGTFTLPEGGLTGEFTLYADEDEEAENGKFWDELDDFMLGEQRIAVEEYKRPAFEVTFQPVHASYRLHDQVTVTGVASAFSGAKLTKATVAYHVRRVVHYPRWYYRRSDSVIGREMEIVSSDTTTGADGTFKIIFPAIPDGQVPKEDRPVFHYEITADVTDINGETRSASTTVRVGYHTLDLNVQAPASVDRQDASAEVSITTKNLNGQNVYANGTVAIYKVKAPATPLRPRAWETPDVFTLTREEANKLFPYHPYDAQSPKGQPEKGEQVWQEKFDTKKSTTYAFDISKNWKLGKYIVEVSAVDSAGLPVKDVQTFTLDEAGNRTVADGEFFIFQTDKPSYLAGEVAKLTIGSAVPDMMFVIDIERGHRIRKTYLERVNGKRKELMIPVGDAKDNGFAIYCTAIADNHVISLTRTIPVMDVREVIEIETLSFKDKIQPGAKETWSFEVKGSTPERIQAEVLASMYDASLDSFKPHEWDFNPIEREEYYPWGHQNANPAFSTSSFDVRNLFLSSHHLRPFFFDQFDWFGFNINNYLYVRGRYISRLYSTGSNQTTPSKVSISNSKNVPDGYVIGRVMDSEGNPLPGVNVVVKGTLRGTVTDVEGFYQIEASKKDMLVFSFIGLVSAEAEVTRKNTVNVQMEQDVTQLSEVVVTGYGVQKQSLSYSMSAVRSDAVSDTTALDFALAPLQGKVAGVSITGPGGPSRLLIRGMTSLNSSNEVLYVVDGVIVEQSQIDQSDLASIQVLKGDAATALYGARAANGVIIVTTKSGQKKLDEEMAKLQTRKDFKETAFFFPHLTTDAEGKIRFTFTTPESLTRWKLQLLAHRKDLVNTIKTLNTVTQKEFMVTPNPPRFLRQGDEIVFSAKIVNLTNRTREGKVALQLSNAVTNQGVDDAFNNVLRNKVFKVTGKGTTEVSWRLKVPSNIEAVQYRVVAKSGNHSDGEQNILPVLTNRILVTETMPMYVRSGQSKSFTLRKLKENKSATLTHHKLTLEVTGNPAWYALQALPYLMEFPYECAEQTFARYYANTLGSHIVNSSPKVKEVFSKWSSANALVSNLEKNQELKSLLIQETPWLREALDESEQKKRIAELFNTARLSEQQAAITEKLQAMQFANGGFPWFQGSPEPSRYITQHIVLSFGHLTALTVDASPEMRSMMRSAVSFCDAKALEDYQWLLESANRNSRNASNPSEAKKAFLDDHQPSELTIQFLYMRTFYPDIPFSNAARPMIDYYSAQIQKHWSKYPLYMRGMITLIQYRYKNNKFAEEKLQSLRELSLVSDELGMYWKENQSGWYWYESPVETHALMIELFSEIPATVQRVTEVEKQKTLDELRIWLLKNKQTSQWKTTKATTDAVYALLMKGADWLSMESQVETKIGTTVVNPDPQSAEAGTGYFKRSWNEKEIKPEMASVTFSKQGPGVAWGGLYWQYFEDLDHITPAETPLKLRKKVFLVTRDARGEKLEDIQHQALKVGDLLRIRIELSVDRYMEFIHLKDMRGAGFEPVDVLSEYKWQEGLGYYQSTRDAATNFFFDSVKKGVYIFEYDLRVNNAGDFSNGIATIQCMYAPEFTSHSDGIRIKVE